MKDLLVAGSQLAAKTGELSEKGMNAVQTLKNDNIWDVLANIIPQEWTDSWDTFKMQLFIGLLIVVGIVLILSVCPSVVRSFIRGLDVAAVGGVLVWLGTRVPEILFIDDMELPLVGVGVALIVLGLFIFIVAKVMGGRRRAKERFKAETEARKQKDLAKRAEELAKPAEVELKIGSGEAETAEKTEK